jgi:hypothetical protein
VSANKTYLGDAVYAEVDEGRLRLTTENGISVTNEIYLEPEVYERLAAYVARLREMKHDANPAERS